METAHPVSRSHEVVTRSFLLVFVISRLYPVLWIRVIDDQKWNSYCWPMTIKICRFCDKSASADEKDARERGITGEVYVIMWYTMRILLVQFEISASVCINLCINNAEPSWEWRDVRQLSERLEQLLTRLVTWKSSNNTRTACRNNASAFAIRAARPFRMNPRCEAAFTVAAHAIREKSRRSLPNCVLSQSAAGFTGEYLAGKLDRRRDTRTAEAAVNDDWWR